jgi:hypothetical protein
MPNQLMNFEEADGNIMVEKKFVIPWTYIKGRGVNERDEKSGVPQRRYGNEKK